MSADNDRVGSAGRAAGKVAGAGRQAADSAEDASQQAMDSKPFRVLLTVGLIAYGVVHILIGWIALQIAWFGGGGEEASQKGALAQIAGGPFGATLLWITVIGLFALDDLAGGRSHLGAPGSASRFQADPQAPRFGRPGDRLRGHRGRGDQHAARNSASRATARRRAGPPACCRRRSGGCW